MHYLVYNWTLLAYKFNFEPNIKFWTKEWFDSCYERSSGKNGYVYVYILDYFIKINVKYSGGQQ